MPISWVFRARLWMLQRRDALSELNEKVQTVGHMIRWGLFETTLDSASEFLAGWERRPWGKTRYAPLDAQGLAGLFVVAAPFTGL